MNVAAGHTSTSCSSSVFVNSSPRSNMPQTKTCDTTPPIDIASEKGMFGWAIVDGINIPLIYRNDTTFVAVRVVEHKFMAKYLKACPDFLESTPRLSSHYVTNAEATLLTEINNNHCAGEFGERPFIQLDLIVKLSDFETYYANLKKFYFDLIKNSDGKKGIFNVHGGWVQMNNTVSPYILRRGVQFVPLPVVKFAAHLLADTNLQGDVITVHEKDYLNHCCKEAGLNFEFSKKTELIPLPLVVAFSKEKIKVRDLPAKNPFAHADYPSSQTIKLEETTKTQNSNYVNNKAGLLVNNKWRFIQPKMPFDLPKYTCKITSDTRRPTSLPPHIPTTDTMQLEPNPRSFTNTQKKANVKYSDIYMSADQVDVEYNRAGSCPPLVPCAPLPPPIVPLRNGGQPETGPKMTKCDELPLDLTMSAYTSVQEQQYSKSSETAGSGGPRFYSNASVPASKVASTVTKPIWRVTTLGKASEQNQQYKRFCTPTNSIDGKMASSTLQHAAQLKRSLNASPLMERSWKKREGARLASNGKNTSQKHFEIKRVKLNDNVISALTRNGESLLLLESLIKLYFPGWDADNFYYTLGDVIGVKVLTLEPYEEQAFIDYYGIHTGSLESNRVVRLTDLQQIMQPLNFIYQAKILKQKTKKASSP